MLSGFFCFVNVNTVQEWTRIHKANSTFSVKTIKKYFLVNDFHAEVANDGESIKSLT